MEKNFKLGLTVTTRAISDKIADNRQFSKDITKAFLRYRNADWGELCEEDIKTNNEALEHGDRILGAYETCEGKIWIITEWDRSATTILFPSEY